MSVRSRHSSYSCIALVFLWKTESVEKYRFCTINMYIFT
jgi:hypothetical protein